MVADAHVAPGPVIGESLLRCTVPERPVGGRDCQLQRHRLMQKTAPTMVNDMAHTEWGGGGRARWLIWRMVGWGSLGLEGAVAFTIRDAAVPEAIKARNGGG